jgi:hypothetical protein
LVVLLGWWFFHPRPALRQTNLWSAVHPWVLELILLAIGVLIRSEVGAHWWPVAWSLLALGLLAPAMEQWFAPRLQVYAVVSYWLAGATFPIHADPSNSKGICPLRLTADQYTYHVIRFLAQ